MYKYFEKLLKEKGITAFQVSKDTGIASSTLSDWKHGITQPKVDKIIIIARYFNVPMENFYATEVE